MEHWLTRTEMLIEGRNIQKLKNSKIAIFGIGGVGSFVMEALVRSGIGTLILIDKDNVDVTNLNRQLIATTKTIGLSKVEVAKSRALEINPEIAITTYKEFVTKENVKNFISKDYDYIIDAIDTITAKLSLIKEANKQNIPIISSMGTGNKLDPTKFEITDISKTKVCPLAKVMRKELKNSDIHHLKCIYSPEEPQKVNHLENPTIKQPPASISFVPSVAGLIIAGEVIKDLIKEEKEH